MKSWLILASVVVFCLYSAGLLRVGYVMKKCPEPIPINTHREDSLKLAAAQWEGKARGLRIEREELKRLLTIYKKGIRPTSDIITSNTNAIRATGLQSAVDTLDHRPE